MAQVRLAARQRAFEMSLEDDGHLTHIAGIKVDQMAARKPPVLQVIRCVGKEMVKCIHFTNNTQGLGGVAAPADPAASHASWGDFCQLPGLIYTLGLW